MLDEIKFTSQELDRIQEKIEHGENINTSIEELDRMLIRYIENYPNILQLRMELFIKIQEKRDTNN